MKKKDESRLLCEREMVDLRKEVLMLGELLRKYREKDVAAEQATCELDLIYISSSKQQVAGGKAILLLSCILVLYAQAFEDLFDFFFVLNYLFEIRMPCFVVYFVEDRQPDEPHGNELWKRHVVRSFRF